MRKFLKIGLIVVGYVGICFSPLRLDDRPIQAKTEDKITTREVKGYLNRGVLYTYEPGDHLCHKWYDDRFVYIHDDDLRVIVNVTMDTKGTENIEDDEVIKMQILRLEEN